MNNTADVGQTKYNAAPAFKKRGPCELLQLLCVTIFKLCWYWLRCIPVCLKKLLPKHPKKLSDQVVLVTGGANGLGRALCLRFASEKCHIAVVDMDYENAKITAEDVKKYNVKAYAYKCDVSDYNAVLQLQKSIETDLGGVDILVNNAGIVPLASLRECKHFDLERVVKVNFISNLWTVRIFLPGMIERKRGHIVAISSLSGLRPQARAITYSATKSAIAAMMISLQEELDADGLDSFIHTTTIYPWFINTRKETIDNIVNKLNPGKMDSVTPEEAAELTVQSVKYNRESVIVPEDIEKWLGVLPVKREYRKIYRKVFIGKMPRLIDVAV